MFPNKPFHLTLILSTLLSFKGIAQKNIDSFLITLHNKDIKFALVLCEPKKWFDSSGNFQHSTIRRMLRSINLYQVTLDYPKYQMIEKLVQLLSDPERDWYANLILYELIDIKVSYNPFTIFRLDSRDKWLEVKPYSTITYKECDMVKWKDYLLNLSPSLTKW